MRPGLIGLRHVAVYVDDVARSLAFYRKVLGMELEWMPDADNAYLTSGSDNLALHRRPTSASGTQAARVLDHIGFAVAHPEDVDVWAQRLEALDVVLVEAPKTHRDGARSLYFEDPDGILIQLIYHPPISSGSDTLR